MTGYRYILATLLLVILPFLGYGQRKVTLSGYLKDASSGESLIGATVYVKEAGTGGISNAYGFYSVSVPPGNYTVIYSYIGYATATHTIGLQESKTFNVELGSEVLMQEVEITSRRRDENVHNTEMGTVTLSVDKIKTLPVVFGETDVLKTLQLMPGVQSAGEGNSGFYVRGGGPDQNLILLDDAVVYNTGHLFGFFSVFNSDALKNTTLIKGGMPANYGGRLSAVVDVSMKEGNMKSYHGEGGIGLIASRLLLEGPIVKDKGSFMISGRRTYIDALIRPFVNKESTFYGSGYYFYDANLKANYQFSPKDRVYLSGYFGRDKFTFRSASQSFNAEIPWGNRTATLRWNHLFNSRMFMNTTVVYNDYNFSFSGGQDNFGLKLASGIRDYNAKMDLDYYSPFGHHFKTGVMYTWHRFTPSQITGSSDAMEFSPDNAMLKYAHEAAAYVMDDFDLFHWLKVTAGLRYSFFAQAGPYTHYNYVPGSNYMQKSDSTVYAAGSIVRRYGGPEPRINARIKINDQSSVKLSTAKTYQYIHMISNNGTTLPTDTWVPSTLIVQPQEAWQYAAGYFRNFFDNALEASVEVYYKDMKHQIEFREGYMPTSVRDQELDYVFGHSEAYGAEFFLNKTRGKFTGWIGYTLSWTYRTFPDLNNGARYPARYDRRHDLSIVASYEHSPAWTFSTVFIYGSGNAITLPTNYYFIDNRLRQEYGSLNGYRLFPYHRLDLSAVYTPKAKKERRFKSSWAFSIYNVYNRYNPYFLYTDTEGTVDGGINAKVKQVSIFPILPSITYNFKF